MPAVDAAQPLDGARRAPRQQWIARRCLCCVATMILTFIATMLVVDWYNPRMVWPGRDSWIWFVINLDSTARVGRIAAFGSALGLLIPDHRLPLWFTRLVIGTLLGMMLAVATTAVLDSIMAERALNVVYEPFADADHPTHLQRPLPYQKFCPSADRSVFSRVLFQGAILGGLVGAVWSLRQRPRNCGLALIALAAIVLLLDLHKDLSKYFGGYVSQQQKRIRN